MKQHSHRSKPAESSAGRTREPREARTGLTPRRLGDRERIPEKPVGMPGRSVLEKAVAFVQKHAWAVVAGYALITLGCVPVLLKLRINGSLRALTASKSAEHAYYEKVRETLGNEEQLVILFQDPRLMTPGKLTQVREIGEAIASECEYVDNVRSIFTVNNIFATDSGLSVNPLFDEIPTEPSDIAARHERTCDNPLFLDNFVTRDGARVVLVANFPAMSEDEFVTTGAIEKTMADVRRILRERADGIDYYVGGLPPLRAYTAKTMMRDFTLLMPLALLVITVVIFMVFHSVTAVWMFALAMMIALVWTLSFMRLAGIELTLATSMVPTLVVVVASSYFIHIMSKYNHNAAEHPALSHAELVRKSLLGIVLTLVFIGVTTCAGFLSLVAMPLRPVRELGLSVSASVFFTLLIQIGLVTACMSLCSRERLRGGTGRLAGITARLISRTIEGIVTLVYSRGTIILVVSAALWVWGLASIPFLVAESDNLAFFSDHTRVKQDALHINENLAGANTMSLVLEAPRENAFHDPAILRIAEDIQRRMHRLGVRKTQSIVDVLKQLHRSFNHNDSSFFRIPDSREAVAQYLLLYSNSSAGDVERMISYDGNMMAIMYRLKSHNTTGWLALKDSIEHYAASRLPEGFTARVTGSPILLALGFSRITFGMIQSVAIAFVLVTLIISSLFRSLKLGLFTLIPNLWPISVALAPMAALGVRIDITTSSFACIALGIAVDDTIHFTRSFMQEYRRAPDVKEAVGAALRKAGSAIVTTSAAVCLGFSVFAFSNFAPVYRFGILCASVMLLCVIADLLILPALLIRFSGRLGFLLDPVVESKAGYGK